MSSLFDGLGGRAFEKPREPTIARFALSVSDTLMRKVDEAVAKLVKDGYRESRSSVIVALMLNADVQQITQDMIFQSNQDIGAVRCLSAQDEDVVAIDAQLASCPIPLTRPQLCRIAIRQASVKEILSWVE